MGVIRFLRAHIDSLLAVALAADFLVEVYLLETPVAGESFLAELEVDEMLAIGAGAAFLLSLAVRTTLPLLPLVLAFVAFALLGRGAFDGITVLMLGAALSAYSVGAWAGGRSGQIGALGVGVLVGLVVLRAVPDVAQPRDIAGPVFVLIGAWLLGLAVRSIRVARRDERVTGALDWETAAGGAPDSPGRDDTVRDLRDVIERAMSTVIMQARNARRSLDADPGSAHRALAVVEAAGTEALEETQRLTGLLLSPDGTPLPEPQPGLADVDFLAEQVTNAGLPVDSRIEGRPLPLTPDLDAVAYRVVHEALMATLEGATEAKSSVVVRYESDELRIEVTDDGVAAEGAEQETAGLAAVRNDVAALGGTLDAGPGEGRGYWVLARLPYEPDWS